MTIYKLYLIVSSIICHSLGFVPVIDRNVSPRRLTTTESVAPGIPKEGIIFVHEGRISVSDTNFNNAMSLGSLNLPTTIQIEALCHNDRFIMLYWIDQYERTVGLVTIEKLTGMITSRLTLFKNRQVYHMLVSPDNKNLFLHEAETLIIHNVKSNTSLEVVKFNETFILVDIFYVHKEKLLYYLTTGLVNRVFLYNIHIVTGTREGTWYRDTSLQIEHVLYDPSVRKLLFFNGPNVVLCPIDRPRLYRRVALDKITSASLVPGHLIYSTSIFGIFFIWNITTFEEPIEVTHHDKDLLQGMIVVYSVLEYSNTMVEYRFADKYGLILPLSRGTSKHYIHESTPLLISAIFYFKFAMIN